MAFTVTRATLENNGPLFIRDVLKENLTDPESRSGVDWIFKSPVKHTSVDFPAVIIENSEVTEDVITFGGATEVTITMMVMVWAKKVEHRDDIAGEIIATIEDVSNTDGTNTMLSQGMTYTSTRNRNNDGYIENFSELVRIKEMNISFKYIKD